MELNVTLKHRIDTAFFQIIDLAPMHRRDLQTMWRVARSRWNELDIELITCRKQNKQTPKYQELEKDLLERLDLIEQYLTFATLLTK
jgi:hypothetical protein